MKAEFKSEAPLPFCFEEALETDFAGSLLFELSQSQDWRREHFVKGFFGEVESTDSIGFESAPDEARVAAWEKLPPAAHEWHPFLTRLRDEICGDQFMARIESIDLAGIVRPSMKVIRYRSGDFLARHSDGDSGLALLIYLTSPDWSPSHGGEFFYCDETGAVEVYSPRSNTALAFPYRAETSHWVSELADEAGLRYTIAFDFAR